MERNNKECSVCKETSGDYSVKHHDHITGNFIDSAQNNCNLKLRIGP